MFGFQEKPVDIVDKYRIINGVIVAIIYILSVVAVLFVDKMDRYYHQQRRAAQSPPSSECAQAPSNQRRQHRRKEPPCARQRMYKSLSEPRLNTRRKPRSVPVARPHSTYYKQYTEFYRCDVRGREFLCIHYLKMKTDSTGNICQVHVWTDEFEYDPEYERIREL